MCGIAGIVSADPAQLTGQRLKKMTDAIAHRGPDGEDRWLSPSGLAGLGHRRLAIIDLSPAGRQPMPYLDRYTVIHNGEIYNYPELRGSLESKGYRFTTRTDTEIIPAAYDLYGPDCLRHFDGMWAFALWDEKERTLFLARDRFGEKPLFFYRDDTQFLFASEMKALWAAGVPKESNKVLLFNFLTIGYTQNPRDATETFFKNIHKLPARSFLRYQAATRQTETGIYWDPRGPGRGGAAAPDGLWGAAGTAQDRQRAIATFSDLLAGSVNRRLRSDVAIGASLSGGLDSSTIVSYILRQMQADPGQERGRETGPGAGPAFPAFSAVFPGFEKDESAYIDAVTRQFNLESYRTEPGAAGLIRDFQRLVAHQEEPFPSSSIYAQFCVSGLAAQHRIKVLLDGQGADELLAGYHKYYPWYWRELYRTDKKRLAHELAAAGGNGIKEPWDLRQRLAALLPGYAGRWQTRRRITGQLHQGDLSRDFVREAGISYYSIPPVSRLNEVLYYNALVNGMEELLRYADRNSMAHGVEVRLPFLDHRLAEFLFSLPACYKIYEGWTKWLLRASAESRLPSGIVWRKDKTGYEPPQSSWMKDPVLQDYIREARKTLVGMGILDAAVLQKKIQPMGAHAAENFDWRYLVAAACIKT